MSLSSESTSATAAIVLSPWVPSTLTKAMGACGDSWRGRVMSRLPVEYAMERNSRTSWKSTDDMPPPK